MWCFSRSQQLSRFHFIKYWSLKFYRLILYDVYPEVIQSCNMKNRHLLKKIEETLYIGQWHLSPLQSKHLGMSYSSPSISSTVQNTLKSPSVAPLYYPGCHPWYEISSFSKAILVWGTARSHRAPNLGCSRAESPGWLDVSLKSSAWDVMHDWARCGDKAANHK